MPMNKVLINTTIISGGTSDTPVTQTVYTDQEQNVRKDIPAGTADGEFLISVPSVAALKMIAAGCKKASGEPTDGTVVLNIRTNSTSSPNDVWVITPENGLVWAVGFPTVNPVTAAITKLFVSNIGTAKGEFFFKVAVDSTPGLAD